MVHDHQYGIGFVGHPDVKQTIELGCAPEEAGFDSAWIAETPITRDAITPMTALLVHTQRLRVGSAAINVYTRGAVLTAISYATMEELSPGRVVLGLRTGSPGPLAQQGYEFDHPVARLEEFVKVVRACWQAPAPIHYHGQFIRTEYLAPEVRPQTSPPIYLCVSGPRALELATRVADGVVLDIFLPPSYVRRAKGLLGREDVEFSGEIAGLLMTSLASTRSEAAARLRPTFAHYLINFPELAERMGLDPHFVQYLRGRAHAGGLKDTFTDLPDDLIARFTLCGSAPTCQERIAEYRAAGLDLSILCPERSSLEKVIAQFPTLGRH
jgi:5,10-methylenetetrahydromethanopterin reductase